MAWSIYQNKLQVPGPGPAFGDRKNAVHVVRAEGVGHEYALGNSLSGGFYFPNPAVSLLVTEALPFSVLGIWFHLRCSKARVEYKENIWGLQIQ